ncbi:ester cyclase [Novosphingobium sp. G106]|uniref:nuclear transport factor 2 family protein n=1 Tax=Novosphingobium sp. G106 TaxID=2849500 RepID=UPI001C2DD05D|nr:ester cyclase [Novosphingobium sp. G106]
MTVRSPRELIEIYWERVYNNGEVELVREVCADPIVRHDPGAVTRLGHDEQIERVKRSVALKPHFTHRVVHADDRFVTSVWNMVSGDGRDIRLCGIEVFEAEDGRLTRCWNSSYEKGFWGEDGDEFDPAALGGTSAGYRTRGHHSQLAREGIGSGGRRHASTDRHGAGDNGHRPRHDERYAARANVLQRWSHNGAAIHDLQDRATRERHAERHQPVRARAECLRPVR